MKTLILVVLLALCAGECLAQTPDYPFVVVSGEAERDITPDKATIDIGVLAFDESSEVAFEKVQSVARAIVAIAKKYGIPYENISSDKITKSVEREVNADKGYRELEILGYNISQNVQVELGDLDSYVEFTESVLKLDNISRVEPAFDSSKRDEYLKEISAEAGEKARNEALILAQSLGFKLLNIQAVRYGNEFERMFMGFGLDGYPVSTEYDAAGAYQRETSTVFIPRSIKVAKTVQIVYRIK